MPDRLVMFVIPAFNEERSVGAAVREAGAVADRVVVVDDGSRDRTAEEAAAAGAIVCRHEDNRGQGAAIQTGLELALALGATHLVTFDADGQHRAEDARRLVERLDRDRLDVVLGTRGWRRHGMPLERFLLLRAGLAFTRLTTGLELTDTHNGLRAFTADAARRLALRQDRMAHASEILHRIASLGLAHAEEPVDVHYSTYSRKKGQSSLGALRVIGDLLRERLGALPDPEPTRRIRAAAIARALAAYRG